MPQPNQELADKIRECRIVSIGCEVTLHNQQVLPLTFGSIKFQDGEITSIEMLDGRCYVRVAIVHVSSRYTGEMDAVITAFKFGSTQHPVVVSSGGAVGEINACVAFEEVTLLPKQTGKGDVVTLRARRTDTA